MQAIKLIKKEGSLPINVEANLVEILSFSDTAALADDTVSIYEYEQQHLTDITLKFTAEGRTMAITFPFYTGKWGQSEWARIENITEVEGFGYEPTVKINWFEIFHNATRLAQLPVVVSTIFSDIPKSTNDVVNNISGTLFELVAAMTKQMNELNTSLLNAMDRVTGTMEDLNNKVDDMQNAGPAKSMSKLFKHQLLMFSSRDSFLSFINEYSLSESQFTPLTNGKYLRMGESSVVGGNNTITNRNLPQPTGSSSFTIQSKAFFVDKGFSGNGWSTLLQEIYSSGAVSHTERKDTTHGLDAVGELAETNSNVALSGGSGPNEFTFNINHAKLGIGVASPEAFTPVYQEVYVVMVNEEIDLIVAIPPSTEPPKTPEPGEGGSDNETNAPDLPVFEPTELTGADSRIYADAESNLAPFGSKQEVLRDIMLSDNVKDIFNLSKASKLSTPITLTNTDGADIINVFKASFGEEMATKEFTVEFGGLGIIHIESPMEVGRYKVDVFGIGFDNNLNTIHVNPYGRMPTFKVILTNTVISVGKEGNTEYGIFIPKQEIKMVKYAATDITYYKFSNATELTNELTKRNLRGHSILRGCFTHKYEMDQLVTRLGSVNKAILTNPNDGTLCVHGVSGRSGRIDVSYSSFEWQSSATDGPRKQNYGWINSAMFMNIGKRGTGYLGNDELLFKMIPAAGYRYNKLSIKLPVVLEKDLEYLGLNK